jgi:hypothetical protein
MIVRRFAAGERIGVVRSFVAGQLDVLVAEFNCDHNPAEIVLRRGAL